MDSGGSVDEWRESGWVGTCMCWLSSLLSVCVHACQQHFWHVRVYTVFMYVRMLLWLMTQYKGYLCCIILCHVTVVSMYTYLCTCVLHTSSNLFSPSLSPGYQRLVNVLCAMSADERKGFVQFVTGSSSLPPGGLVNLYPRLTIVRKDYSDKHVMPSVNTCAHYLKMPEYPTEEMVRQRLLDATKEKAFLLN